MARWRLTSKHYLPVVGNQWLYQEVNAETGKPARKMYDVPMFLDPDDKTQVNRDGDIIVSDGNGSLSGDYVFTGEPTPDMVPLDEAAEAISAMFQHKWNNSIDALPSDFSQSILDTFQRQLAEAYAKSNDTVAPPTVVMPAVSKEDFAALKQQVQALMEQNAALIAQQQKVNEAPVDEAAPQARRKV